MIFARLFAVFIISNNKFAIFHNIMDKVEK